MALLGATACSCTSTRMTTFCHGPLCCFRATPCWWCSDMLQANMSLMGAVRRQQGVDAEERVKELEDCLDFAWRCEADTRRLAVADAALAQARIHDLTQRLAAAEGRALQVLLCGAIDWRCNVVVLTHCMHACVGQNSMPA